MVSIATEGKTEPHHLSENDKLRIIENHKKAAKHFAEAARFHLEAAKNYEQEEKDKAQHNTTSAYAHCNIAIRATLFENQNF